MIFPNLASPLVMYVNLMYVNVCNMIPARERERGKTAGDRVSATETETATGTHHSQARLTRFINLAFFNRRVLAAAGR